MNILKCNIFNDGVVSLKDSTIIIQEKINTQQEKDKMVGFENVDYIDVEVKINNACNHVFYQLFDERKEDGKKNEYSRISFLNIKNFPDGILLTEGEDKEICCHIIELKHSPADKILKLKKQLYMGYLHCMSFLSSINKIQGYNITFKYYICGYHKRSRYYDQFMVSGGNTVKGKIGKTATHHELVAYKKYLNEKKILFPYTTNFTEEESIICNFSYVQLDIKNISPTSVELYGEINI